MVLDSSVQNNSRHILPDRMHSGVLAVISEKGDVADKTRMSIPLDWLVQGLAGHSVVDY